jgi:hypothetical protein
LEGDWKEDLEEEEEEEWGTDPEFIYNLLKKE